MRLILRILAPVAVGLIAAPAVDARTCKTKHVNGNANAFGLYLRSATEAKDYARQHWVVRCDKLYPGAWCNPSIAADTRSDCNQQPNGFGGFNWTCEHSARPCKN